jgi:hypothetical protein
MSRRKKKELQDLDVRIARAWKNFRDKITYFSEKIDEAYVELAFEASVSPLEHYDFAPDEAIYISDIQIIGSGEVAFKTQFGIKDRFFLYKHSELITTNEAGVKRPLDEILRELFAEAFCDVKEVENIETLESKYLSKDVLLREMFNDIDYALAQFELSKERANKYAKLPYYGLF